MCPRPGMMLNITATMSLALPSAVCVALRTQSQRSQRSAFFGRRCPQYGHGILSPVVGSGRTAGASVYSTFILSKVTSRTEFVKQREFRRNDYKRRGLADIVGRLCQTPLWLPHASHLDYPWLRALFLFPDTCHACFRRRNRLICSPRCRRFSRCSARRCARDLSRHERLPIRIPRPCLACGSLLLARGPFERSTWFAHSTECRTHQRWTASSRDKGGRDSGDPRTFRSLVGCPGCDGKDTGASHWVRVQCRSCQTRGSFIRRGSKTRRRAANRSMENSCGSRDTRSAIRRSAVRSTAFADGAAATRRRLDLRGTACLFDRGERPAHLHRLRRNTGAVAA